MTQHLVKLTEKGQMTIPVGIRKALQLKPGDYLSVMQVGDGIVLKKNKNKEPLSNDDPIWELLGVANSGKRDISEKHDRYVAEGELDRWRNKP